MDVSVVIQGVRYTGRAELSSPLPAPPPSGPRLPAGRKFARIHWNFEWSGVSRPTLDGSPNSVNGLPDTAKVLYPAFVDMTREWQWYWVDVFSLSRFGALYKDLSEMNKAYVRNAFKGVTVGWRAFTNRRSWNNGYADYVNGVNVNSDPMGQETINCGGNVVEVLSDKVRLGGKDVYKVRTLDGTKKPPNPLEVNLAKTPWLVFEATISRREQVLVGGSWDGKTWNERIEIGFPQLGGSPVPVPFMGKGDFNYLEAHRLEMLPDNALVPRTRYP